MMNDVDLGAPPETPPPTITPPRPYPEQPAASPPSSSEKPDPPERLTPRRQPPARHTQDDTETGHAGDLPGVEEYKAQHGLTGGDENKNKCLWRTIYASLVVLITVILITIGVVIGRDTAEPSSGENDILNGPDPPTPVPVSKPNNGMVPDGPKSRLYQIMDFVQQQGWSTSNDLTPGSAQYNAATWLADDDEAKMDPADTTEFKERYALAALYYAFSGLDWPQDVNWMTKENVCEWYHQYHDQDDKMVKIGVECNEQKSVQEISLRGLQLYGSIPGEIALLENLVSFDVRHNKLTKGFPSQFVNLSNLQTLIVEDNNLEGSVPGFLGNMKTLAKINLSRNKFSGQLPSTLKKLQSLNFLSLEHNQFTGPVSQLQGLGTVQALLIGDNQFTGKLEAPVFNSWKNIQALDISDNRLTGNLPQDLFAVSNLNILDLHGNQLEGPLPNLVSVNSDVVFLALQENNFTGNPGARLQFMEQLEHLDLSHNQFTGTMPTELGKLAKLRYLFLAFNEKLAFGRIPTEYGSLTALVDLSLQKTNRVETIPSELGHLSQLYLLDLNQNILTGNLPPELGNLGRLKYLLLKDNKLGGSIPNSFSQLVNLDSIIIDKNIFTGTADAICNPKLPKLEEFMASCLDLTCPCCTHCCVRGKGEEEEPVCDNVVWFAGQDPVYDEHYQFERWYYMFHESYVRYPVWRDDEDGGA